MADSGRDGGVPQGGEKPGPQADSGHTTRITYHHGVTVGTGLTNVFTKTLILLKGCPTTCVHYLHPLSLRNISLSIYHWDLLLVCMCFIYC